MKKLVTDRRLWLTADREHVVEDGDELAAFLLVAGAGRTIPAEDVARLKLKVVRGRVTYPDAPELEGDGGAGEADEEKDRKVIKMGGAAEDSDQKAEPPPVWTQRTGPEAYLRRHPTGPNAALAKAVIAAKEDGADGGS